MAPATQFRTVRRRNWATGFENCHQDGGPTPCLDQAITLPTHGPRNWKSGDIAFLKKHECMSCEDRNSLVASGYLPWRATGHPVIILRRDSAKSTHALVTPVSAYSSGPENNNLAPWKQDRHRHKRPHDFRSFQGSEQADKSRPLLQLANGDVMPKPKTSWVHVQSAWVVPLSALAVFDKAPHRLRMTQESLAEIRRHFLGSCSCIRERSNDPRLRHVDETIGNEPRPRRPACSPRKHGAGQACGTSESRPWRTGSSLSPSTTPSTGPWSTSSASPSSDVPSSRPSTPTEAAVGFSYAARAASGLQPVQTSRSCGRACLRRGDFASRKPVVVLTAV